MEREYIKKLSIISKEESEILDSKKGITKDLYTTKETFYIEGKKFLSSSNISLKVHTRFVDFPLHSHDYLEMMYVLSGSITHIIDHNELKLEQGDLIIMNKYVEHSIKKANKDDIGINFILSDSFLVNILSKLDQDTLLYRFIENNLKNDEKSEYLVYKINNNILIKNIIDNMIYLIKDNNDEYKLIQDTVALLFTYLNHFNGILLFSNNKENKEEKDKETIIKYIKQNTRFATLYELSKILGYSIEYTSRKIKRLFGKNYKTLLTDERLLLASNLLKSTDLSVMEIISRVGYENKSYFHREFKERYGTTPHKWRQ